MTLKDVAFAADIEISQIFRIEKGKVNPTLSTLNALAKAYQIKINVLLDFEII